MRTEARGEQDLGAETGQGGEGAEKFFGQRGEAVAVGVMVILILAGRDALLRVRGVWAGRRLGPTGGSRLDTRRPVR